MNINSPIFEFITTLIDFILLNLLFLLSCLPVFTIGAAICALYDVTMKEAREEGGYIFSRYMHSFIYNFKQATVAFLLYLFTGAILLFNLIFWNNLHTVIGTILFTLVFICSLGWGISFLYCFPLLSRFDNRLKQSLINSFLIGLEHIHTTILLVMIQLLVIGSCLVIPGAKIFMILLGFSFIAYCNSMLFVKTFRGYEQE